MVDIILIVVVVLPYGIVLVKYKFYRVKFFLVRVVENAVILQSMEMTPQKLIDLNVMAITHTHMFHNITIIRLIRIWVAEEVMDGKQYFYKKILKFFQWLTWNKRKFE